MIQIPWLLQDVFTWHFPNQSKAQESKLQEDIPVARIGESSVKVCLSSMTVCQLEMNGKSFTVQQGWSFRGWNAQFAEGGRWNSPDGLYIAFWNLNFRLQARQSCWLLAISFNFFIFVSCSFLWCPGTWHASFCVLLEQRLYEQGCMMLMQRPMKIQKRWTLAQVRSPWRSTCKSIIMLEMGCGSEVLSLTTRMHPIQAQNPKVADWLRSKVMAKNQPRLAEEQLENGLRGLGQDKFTVTSPITSPSRTLLPWGGGNLPLSCSMVSLACSLLFWAS